MTEEQVQALLQLAGDFIFVMDGEGVLGFWHSNRKRTGWPEQQARIGKWPEGLFPLEAAQRHREEIRQVMESGAVVSSEDGLTGGVWIRYRLAPVLDEKGRRTSVLGIGRSARKGVGRRPGRKPRIDIATCLKGP